ncbi:thioesterase II family protein [Clostridium sp. LP20]|uniref:thioesterase II family protein n=1 Tax=Clostridium sp. LP20 TaxID=3418665 RepID=UPI003EE59F4A
MSNKWILKSKTNVEGNYRLFCIPYAGGGASIYRSWQKNFSHDIEICPIQLPGRENRIEEFLINDARLLARRIYGGIKQYLDKPFSILGYSAGGVLAYELTSIIYRELGKMPDFLFMGATTLDFSFKTKKVHGLDEKEFIEYIESSGGTEKVILKDREFRNVFFPIIRNDYKMIENYCCNKDLVPCPIIAIASKEDEEVPFTETLKLESYTDNFNIKYFDGNHFFLKKHEKEICQFINKEILINKK